MQTPDWICNDGTAICLSSMSNSHVLSAWTYLRSGTGPHGPMLREGCSGFKTMEWLLLFETELLMRPRRMGGGVR